MEHNPLKPDEKRPWCKKCRAHTSYAQGQHGVVGHQILKCDWCEGEMLKNVYGMTHSSRLGCIVPGWLVFGVLLILMGSAIFGSEDPVGPPGTYNRYTPFVAIFFLVCGAGCFAMVARLSRLRGSWTAWVKEQGGKTDEELEEEAKQWPRNLPAQKKKKKKRRYKSKSKQVRRNIIVGAILAAAGQWWLTSAGVEDPWSYAPGVPLGIYILFVYNFTTME